MFLTQLPKELNDKILMMCPSHDIILWNTSLKISNYVLLRKKERTLKEACINNNTIGLNYMLKNKVVEKGFYTNDAIVHCIKIGDHAKFLKIFDHYYTTESSDSNYEVDKKSIDFFIHEACKYDNKNIVKHLYEHSSKSLNTMYDFLGRFGSVKVAKYLIGFVTNYLDLLYGIFRSIDYSKFPTFVIFYKKFLEYSPISSIILNYVISHDKPGTTRFFNYIIKNNTQQYDVNRALMLSINSGNKKIISYFVKNGATNINHAIIKAKNSKKMNIALWLFEMNNK